MSTVKSMHTYLVYALSIIFFLLGIFGYLDIKNYTYDGYSTSDFTVTKVETSGPADIAGMQVGDQLKSIDGLDIRDTKAWADKARRTVGETRTFVADRNGEEVTYDLTFSALPQKDSVLSRLGWTIGLIFLLMGLWGFQSNKSWAAFLFTMFCLGFAGSFMGGPYIENNIMDDLVDTMRFSFVLLSFAFLVDFLLHYPKKSSFATSTNASKIIYGPAIFLILFFFAITILQSDATSGLNTFIRFAMLAYIVVYFGWALLTMFRKYRNATSDEKSEGLSLMFWGTVIGLVPILIVVIIDNLMPTVELPGQDYMFITMAIIPISFATALNKK